VPRRAGSTTVDMMPSEFVAARHSPKRPESVPLLSESPSQDIPRRIAYSVRAQHALLSRTEASKLRHGEEGRNPTSPLKAIL
jgi:hypothetical protein